MEHWGETIQILAIMDTISHKLKNLFNINKLILFTKTQVTQKRCPGKEAIHLKVSLN